MFWTKKAYSRNRFWVLCSDQMYYNIPSKEFKIFCDDNENVKHIKAYLSEEKEVGFIRSWINLIKHCYWELTGFEVD